MNSGNLMGVVTAGAGIAIMTGVACHTMKSMNQMYKSSNRTSSRRSPARRRR